LLNARTRTPRSVGRRRAFPEVRSSTYWRGSKARIQVGAASRNSVAWHENRSSSGPAPAGRVYRSRVSRVQHAPSCSVAAGAGAAAAASPVSTRRSQPSFQ
jgi:hypothetical protein